MFRGVNGNQSWERKKEQAKDAALAASASSSLKIYLTHWLDDDLNLLDSKFIKLIGIAKVAAVVALGWDFTVQLLQCFYMKPLILLWIQVHEFIKILFRNEFGSIHYRNLSYDFLNSCIFHYWIQIYEFESWIHIMNSYLWICVCEFKVYLYEFMIYMNSCAYEFMIYMNSCAYEFI